MKRTIVTVISALMICAGLAMLDPHFRMPVLVIPSMAMIISGVGLILRRRWSRRVATFMLTGYSFACIVLAAFVLRIPVTFQKVELPSIFMELAFQGDMIIFVAMQFSMMAVVALILRMWLRDHRLDELFSNPDAIKLHNKALDPTSGNARGASPEAGQS